MTKPRFHPEALQEYTEAIRWYEERSNVAPSFVSAIERAVDSIGRRPRTFVRWQVEGTHEIRRCLVRRFPFLIIYRVAGEEVLILAVAHVRRRPGYWLERLRR